MSDFKVPVTKILEITPHSNADSLEFAKIYGFQVVVRKGVYQPGDQILYIPIDTVLSDKVQELLFPEGSKIRPTNGRIRQIKIRGQYSAGMVVSLEDLVSLIGLDAVVVEERCYAEELGLVKYEPPTRGASFSPSTKHLRNKADENPYFHKFNGLTNLRWQPDLFKEGDEVIIQEKVHGSLCRAGLLPSTPNTLWKKIKDFLGLFPKWEYTYGSNNVQLQDKSSYTGFYGEDVYGAVLHKVDAFNKLKPGETIYGELVGAGIQQNYDYGHKDHHFVLFDVKVLQDDGSQKWLDPEAVEQYAKDRGFDFVPVLYRGPFSLDIAKELTKGNSVYCPEQKVREGVVIKRRVGYDDYGNKTALKLISEAYLDDKQNTDFH